VYVRAFAFAFARALNFLADCGRVRVLYVLGVRVCDVCPVYVFVCANSARAFRCLRL